MHIWVQYTVQHENHVYQPHFSRKQSHYFDIGLFASEVQASIEANQVVLFAQKTAARLKNILYSIEISLSHLDQPIKTVAKYRVRYYLADA